ncbi:MAG: hypothetical protein ABF384_17565 [Verrucomicrobiales bacterium]|jgi:hypothetical protein
MKTCLFLMVVLTGVVWAQMPLLQGGEWFLDVDPGEGQGTPIALSSSGPTSDTVVVSAGTINALSEGVHLLGVRYQDDDGEWGQVVWRAFLNQHPAQNLVAGEWFFDNDPGEGQGTPLSNLGENTTTQNFTIPAATVNGLSEGVHLLGVRFKADDGEWGHTVWRAFLNQHPNSGLAAGEFFFNTDPGHGAATSLTGISGDDLSTDFTASLASLPAGANLLGVRFKHGDGEWGQTVFRVFLNPEAGSRLLNRVEFVVYRGVSRISAGALLGDGSLAFVLTHRPNDVAPVLGETLLLELQVVDDGGRRGHKVFREIVVQEFTASFLDLFFSGAEQTDPLVSGDDADADGDGLANIVEQAMGLHPREANGGADAALLRRVDGDLQFDFRAASEATFDPVSSTFGMGGLSFEVEVSDGLGGWSRATSPGDFTVSPGGLPGADGSFLHTLKLTGGGERRFFRLRIRRD